ncbi:ABC transporter ATP-binding protein [Amphibacillus cookii]|uniref:ABC transporter ATP-binding protein n=1 Tax=Amphibacillus cookii TaxID=767787 RepID=UPI001959CA6F|nr:ABC transporter ATP-binding protein [Amphibacillus cookii]MBM7540240.1 fluoroquinolone transport system ATP-binding protein [Amphibacillus cookii]
MIHVCDLSFTYPKASKPSLTNLNFSVNKGEIFGILGPSGAGKSTLQKVLLGVLPGYSGTVEVMGQHANRLTSDFYQQLGVSFEVPNFYQKFTVIENLTFFRSFYQNHTIDIITLLEAVNLIEAKDQRVSNLSKGMKMRLNICRAFLHDPDLIFLDEPTAGLDPVNTKDVMTLIKQKQAEGKTLIINTHNMQVAEYLCDRVAFIVDGEIKEVVKPKVDLDQTNDKSIRITYRQDRTQKTKTFPLNNLGDNHDFLAILSLNTITAIETEQQSLEQLFIEVTGRGLE